MSTSSYVSTHTHSHKTEINILAIDQKLIMNRQEIIAMSSRDYNVHCKFQH